MDTKPERRIRDSDLLSRLHAEWEECALCLSTGWEFEGDHRTWIGLSLHHVCKHPRDDVRGNLIMLCGDGVRGCHGEVELLSAARLGRHIRSARPDIIEHIRWRFGETAEEWLRIHLGIDS